MSHVRGSEATDSSAERAREILRHLIAERHALEAAGADPAAVEANRIAIAYWQAHSRPTRRRTVRP